ncbi:MAG: aa3-type cytochrome c oxidase subunit IV [Alphaproteobacteria bacterium]
MAKPQTIAPYGKDVHAHQFAWAKFTHFTKIGVISVVVLLALMAVFLV